MNLERHNLATENKLIKPQRAPWVKRVERGDNTLILASERNRNSMVLNEVAATIWELCDGESSYEKILCEFKRTYRYKEDAEHDILTMMIALQGQGLLYLGDENDSPR